MFVPGGALSPGIELMLTIYKVMHESSPVFNLCITYVALIIQSSDHPNPPSNQQPGIPSQHLPKHLVLNLGQAPVQQGESWTGSSPTG